MSERVYRMARAALISGRRGSIIGALAVALLMSTGTAVRAQQTRYIYDAAGRLIGVIDAQGHATVYEYDEVGNLLAIRRPAVSDAVVITYVNPAAGLSGDRVDIFGVGFSAVASQNQVAFNGIAAPVVAASATRLTVTVPGAATTGVITVSTPSGAATSPAPFRIPTITIAPLTAVVPLGRQRQFAISLAGLTDRRATWSVAGIAGGNPAIGTIDQDGLYTAPADWPATQIVEIQARSVAFPGLAASATVAIVPPSASVVAAPVDIRVTRVGIGEPGGLPANVVVASPSYVTAVRPALADPGGLALNTTIAPPSFITVVRPVFGDSGGLGLNVFVGAPPFIVISRPGSGDGETQPPNVTVATPPDVRVRRP